MRPPMTKSAWNYQEIYVGEGVPGARQNGCLLEHRVVAEQVLGRPLKSKETVHHKDENRANNLPENILVFRSQSDHVRFHQTGVLELQSDGAYISPAKPLNACRHCGRPCKRIFCSETCSAIGKRQVPRPSKDQLEQDVQALSWVAIGRKYGVSDNAVRKWARQYKL
jgi:hypothetical protein